MDIGLMVEGQDGLTWDRWRHILALAERLNFPTLFRSDHYFIGTHQQSLEAYLSFVLAATETSRIRFGPLVSPITFRRPVNVARMAAQLDELSDGRFVLGLGGGWNEDEHRAYGVRFPPLRERFDRLEEALQLTQTLWNDNPASYDGRFYQLDGVDSQPRPPAGRPPILIGGAGEKRTLRIAAQYASEWNCLMLAPDDYAHKVDVFERHCEDLGRDPSTVRRSMMVFGLVGPTQKHIDGVTDIAMRRFLPRVAPGETISRDEFHKRFRAMGSIVGATDELLDTLGRLAEHGLDEVQFQHLKFDDDDIPEYLAADIAPQVKAL